MLQNELGGRATSTPRRWASARIVSHGLILAPRVGSRIFRARAVYLRTSKGQYWTDYPSVSKLLKRLEPRSFLRINRSLVVNTYRIVGLDLTSRWKEVDVGLGQVESLIVSRRSLTRLRARRGQDKDMGCLGSELFFLQLAH